MAWSGSPSRSGRLALAMLFAVACGTDNNGGQGDGGDGGGGNDAHVSGDASGGGGDAHVGDGGGGGGGDMPIVGNLCDAPTSIDVTPAATTAKVTAGMAFTQTFQATAHYAGKPDADASATAFWSLSDASLGTFAGPVFTWGGAHGGTSSVAATLCGVTGSTTITLDLTATVGTTGTDPKTSAMKFMNAPASSTQACAPNLVYPPDGVLLPPNTNVVEVHFTLGSPANNLFEVSFENASTDVRVYTSCTGATPADGQPMNGGCVFELSQAEWDYIAKSNRDGAPIKVTVKGLGCDASGGAASSNSRSISFAKEDVVGALYYWASIRISGGTVNSGGVYSYDFGVRGQTATPVLTPSSGANPTGLCIGCHSVSRDGRQLVFDFDDNDDDDEYNDVRTDVYDIVNQKAAQPIVKNGTNTFPPGYSTWNHETTQFLLSDGAGTKSTPPGAFRRVTPMGTTSGYAQSGTIRGTTPDWAPDDGHVVFAVPTQYLAPMATTGATTGPDLWFLGASIVTAPWDAMASTLGTATPLVKASGTQNYYYPSYSPEGSLVAFNYAPSGPNFHNPLARVQVVPAGTTVQTPVDLAKLNDTGNLTNSWARWSPFVQTYQGNQLLWITFSSTRAYGLRYANDSTKQNCYPNESPKNFPVFSMNTNCTRAQLWMAAVKLDPNGVAMGIDPSWPAFWLPFQDITTNNHLAQWAQQSFTGPCTMNSDCKVAGASCCSMGGCTACPTPPPPMCTSDATCAPGSCCVGGSCISCASIVDGGVPDMKSPDGGPPPPTGCNTCLDCNGQACVKGTCGSCTSNADCCSPLVCSGGQCVPPIG